MISDAPVAASDTAARGTEGAPETAPEPALGGPWDIAAPRSASPRLEPPGEPLLLSWKHPAGMAGLAVKNFVLRVLTLGMYHFWGKTEVRQRIWGAIRVNGEPLRYTGTGSEMLRGFVIVLGVMGLPALILSVAVAISFGPDSAANRVYNLALSLGFYFLVGVGAHRAARYRMSRTTWRGIRGGLEGSSWHYGWTCLWTGAVLILTLGWASPWRTTRLQRLITDGLRLGNLAFAFDARPGPLYGPFAVLWVASVAAIGAGLTIGFGSLQVMLSGVPSDMLKPAQVLQIVVVLYALAIGVLLAYALASAWYRARLMNHFAAHTTFGNVRLKGSATGTSLVWLSFSNTVMVLLTLGLLAPVAQARSARYLVERLQLEGEIAVASIVQRGDDRGTRGEGLAQAFDIDAF